MRASQSAPVICAGLVACLGTLAAAAATPAIKASPSKTLETRDPPGDTLVEGYYWVRTVQEPYFHFYLQTAPELSAGEPGIVGEPASAAQFAVENGQLVELVDTDGTVLYMNVEEPAGEVPRKLPVTFAEAENSFGEFEWQGDSLTWSVSSIDRPNTAAWLICEDDLVYINTGAFGWETPEGCSDATIHYYNGATADP